MYILQCILAEHIYNLDTVGRDRIDSVVNKCNKVNDIYLLPENKGTLSHREKNTVGLMSFWQRYLNLIPTRLVYLT